LAIYIATLLCGSCEEAIFLYNSREVDYFKEGPNVCFNHNIINEVKSIANVVDTFNNFNKNLLSNTKNDNYTLQCSSNISREIGLPFEITKPKSLYFSIRIIQVCGSVVIFKVPGDIFRPPESIKPFIV
jgi:hypothetical protein